MLHPHGDSILLDHQDPSLSGVQNPGSGPLHRRLARDYETLPTRSEAMIHLAMTGLMARRLTSENTISWRDPKNTTEHPITG